MRKTPLKAPELLSINQPQSPNRHSHVALTALLNAKGCLYPCSHKSTNSRYFLKKLQYIECYSQEKSWNFEERLRMVLKDGSPK
jgi:hypothetical protein